MQRMVTVKDVNLRGRSSMLLELHTWARVRVGARAKLGPGLGFILGI